MANMLCQSASNNMDNSEHTSIDINQIGDPLKEKFETLYPLSQDCCIYRVPRPIRRLNPSDYTPQIVSIGPLHHGKEELKAMEEHKIRYLQHFLERTKVSIGVFLALIKDNEAKLRGCYAETIDLENEDFVRMILVDAVFLNEYFLRGYQQSLITDDDRIFRKPGINIWNDLWLVENQLPLFILYDLFDLAKTETDHNDYQELTLITITSWFRKGVFYYVRIDNNLLEKKFDEAEHFVDLLRLCLHQSLSGAETEIKVQSIPSAIELHQQSQSSPTQSEFRFIAHRGEPELQPFHSLPTQTTFKAPRKASAAEQHQAPQLPTQTKFKAPRKTSAAEHHQAHQSPTQTEFKASNIPSATELHQAGVMFKLGSRTNLLDITFNKGILEIPPIECYDNMERFYRNILAFEKMHGYPKYFNDYVLLMCYLVNTAKDAELLIQNKIIVLGNGERMSAVFRSLDKNCFLTSNFQYSGLVEELRSYCDDSPWHKWKATLKQDYFSNPWASISVIAAVVLLVLTIIQTACSIIALKK